MEIRKRDVHAVHLHGAKKKPTTCTALITSCLKPPPTFKNITHNIKTIEKHKLDNTMSEKQGENDC